ncbi:class I SAM-dependent methyltransferase, partial [Candidatus Parcubacteria bacterium]
AWLDYRSRFANVYDEANYDQSLQGFAMRVSHRLLEKDLAPGEHFSRVVEVGAGTGEHFPYVRHSFDEYIMTDMDADALKVARQKVGVHHKVAFECRSATELDYPSDSVDRLVAVHVLEHLYFPHRVLKEWNRVVKDGGVISILIPTDPGLAWRLGRYLGPRRRAIAQGIEYDYVMAREHVNSCTNLMALIRFYFRERKERWWPFVLPAVDVNLFVAIHATVRKSP